MYCEYGTEMSIHFCNRVYIIYYFISGTEHNFAKYTNDTVTDFGVMYDYNSVMHYPETAFSTNGNRTIVPVQVSVKCKSSIAVITFCLFLSSHHR